MRKSPLIILLSVILLAIFSAPFFFGMMAEKHIKKFVQTISPNADVKIAIQSYKRGWFKSDVNFTVQVNSSQIHRVISQLTEQPLDPQIQNIILNGTTTIFHGPLVFKSQVPQTHFVSLEKAALIFNAAISPESQKVLMNSLTGTFPIVSGTAKIGFDNDIKIALTTGSLNIQQKNTGNSVHFSELKGNWQFNLKDKFTDGAYVLNGLGIAGNGMALNVETVEASYQGEGEIFHITPHLGIMNETIKVPHAVIQENQKTIFELTNGKLFNQSVLKDNKYDVTQIIEVDKATLDEKSYGPGRYIVVFKHIDPAVADQFIRQLTALKATTSEKERNYLALAGVSSFAQFFTKGAELELSFDLLTPEGPVAARSQAAFNANQNPAANLATNIPGAQGLDFLKKLKLNFEVKIPIALTEKVFTSINEQYLEHQRATQKAAAAQPTASVDVPQPLPQVSLVEKTDQEIEQLAEQNTKQQLLQLINAGSLIESNGSYQMNIELKDGNLLVNGKNAQQPSKVEQGVTTAPSTTLQPQPVAPIMLLAPNALKSANPTEQQNNNNQNTTIQTAPVAPAPSSANQVTPAAPRAAATAVNQNTTVNQ